LDPRFVGFFTPFWTLGNIIRQQSDCSDLCNSGNWFACFRALLQVIASYDPNRLFGPGGFGDQHWVKPIESFIYTIQFENEASATAAVQAIQVATQLEPTLDWMTFELMEVGWGPHVVSVPPDTTHYEGSQAVDGWTWIDQQGWHTGATPLIVDIATDINITTGRVEWHLSCKDPNTGWPPSDPYAGFLPPADPNGDDQRGDGLVNFDDINPFIALLSGGG
jgi:hypothetical protein